MEHGAWNVAAHHIRQQPNTWHHIENLHGQQAHVHIIIATPGITYASTPSMNELWHAYHVVDVCRRCVTADAFLRCLRVDAGVVADVGVAVDVDVDVARRRFNCDTK